MTIKEIKEAPIKLDDVKATLERLPDVAEAVVVTARDKTSGPVAYLTLSTTAGMSLDEDAVRAALRLSLPAAMVPKRFVVLATIPRTADGEVDDDALDDPALLRRAPDALRGLPKTDGERQLLALFEEVLRVWPLGTEESFFALGGDQPLALHLLFRIEQELGVCLGIEALREAPSVTALARRLEAERAVMRV